jgi:hypothetical protein
MWELNDYGLLVPTTRYTYGPPVGLKGLRTVLGKKYTFDAARREMSSSAQGPPGNIQLDSFSQRASQTGLSPEVRVVIGANATLGNRLLTAALRNRVTASPEARLLRGRLPRSTLRHGIISSR